jgi:hypothetical protein
MITLSIQSMGCKKNVGETDATLLISWVKNQKTMKGEAAYPGNELKVVLSSPLTVSFPDIQAYRGSIISKEKQWDGIFFINKKDHSIQFMDANNQKSEEK